MSGPRLDWKRDDGDLVAHAKARAEQPLNSPLVVCIATFLGSAMTGAGTRS